MNGAMSAIGTKQTLASAPQMSAIGGKADSAGRYHRAVHRIGAVIPTPRMGT